ncbi:UNVERIFIED_CONTAM: Oleuropein beta-glucosidase [Sesamum angustifolium]|uniref:Oleuropein beta-glucosidase n=1 Tax=Sesamum angustifolium TaxID=2727405 RepID=A0AAW2N736_9LAMI
MANNVAGAQLSRYGGAKLTRHDFPADFVFGGATSTYQVEGGYAQDGKIIDGSNGCVAIDHYNRFKDDVRLMKKLGIDAYRFSISWSRILPGGRLNGSINREGIKYYNDLIDLLLAQGGRLSGGINREAIKYYNDLIDLLLAQGIEPFVTIFHFDVPQCLEEEYGGFLSPKIVQDFAEFAELCFFEFGDRVKFWITQNEPVTFAKNGYVLGSFPPGHGSTSAHPSAKNAVGHRCCRGVDRTCYGGDAGIEPYIVGHHLIIAHAVAVDIYRRNYQAVQGGKIGITNMSGWFEPYSNAQTDIDAASRAVDFMLGCGARWGSNWRTGVNEKNDRSLTIAKAIKDDYRIKFHQDHLAYVKEAIDSGARIKGYFAWSLFDNYEWAEGYSVRFGMFYIDYVNGYTRYPKKSAIWYMNFLNKNVLPRTKRQVEEIEDDNATTKRKKGR